jgi:hypothetical protein
MFHTDAITYLQRPVAGGGGGGGVHVESKSSSPAVHLHPQRVPYWYLPMKTQALSVKAAVHDCSCFRQQTAWNIRPKTNAGVCDTQ